MVRRQDKPVSWKRAEGKPLQKSLDFMPMRRQDRRKNFTHTEAFLIEKN
jgi:hypothetical protein